MIAKRACRSTHSHGAPGCSCASELQAKHGQTSVSGAACTQQVPSSGNHPQGHHMAEKSQGRCSPFSRWISPNTRSRSLSVANANSCTVTSFHATCGHAARRAAEQGFIHSLEGRPGLPVPPVAQRTLDPCAPQRRLQPSAASPGALPALMSSSTRCAARFQPHRPGENPTSMPSSSSKAL